MRRWLDSIRGRRFAAVPLVPAPLLCRWKRPLERVLGAWHLRCHFTFALPLDGLWRAGQFIGGDEWPGAGCDA